MGDSEHPEVVDSVADQGLAEMDKPDNDTYPLKSPISIKQA